MGFTAAIAFTFSLGFDFRFGLRRRGLFMTVLFMLALTFTPGFFPGIFRTPFPIPVSLRFIPRGLNPAQGAPQIFNLPFIIQLLFLRQFNQFQNVLHLFQRLFERFHNPSHFIRSPC